MANIEELVIQLSAETKDLQAELKSSVQATKQATDQMAKSVDEFSKKGSDGASFFQQSMATMAGFIGGQAVIGALTSVKDMVVSFAQTMIVEGVGAAIEQQNALNQLSEALSRTGKNSQEAMASMNAFASQMQRTTKFSDDAVVTSAALIQSLADLDTNGLQRATSAAADMATALNVDLQTASSLVGKALTGNVGALSRYGIAVKEGSTASQTMANVLDALSSKFGGAAAGALKTYSGQVAALTNNWGDVKEEIGFAIIENRAVTGALGQVNVAVSKMIAYLQENKDAIKEWVAEGLIGAVEVMRITAAIINETIQAVRGLAQGFMNFFEILGGAKDALNLFLGGELDAAFNKLGETFDSTGQQLDEAFTKDTVFGVLEDSLGDVQVAAQIGLEAMRSGTEATIDPINRMAQATRDLANAEELAAQSGEKLAETLITSSANAQAQYELELELLRLNLEEKMIAEEEFWMAKEQLRAERYATEQASLDAARKQNLITETQYKQATTQLEKQSDLDQRKSIAERTKFEKDQQKQRERNLESTFGVISTMSTANNKTLAGIGKAAAITQATIDGYSAVQKALASAPPPFNFVLAGLVGAATAANVAKIAGVPLATGIDSVPGIGSRDNFPAVLAPGERVVPTKTNEDLTRFLNGEGDRGALRGASGPIVIQLELKGDLADLVESKIIEREELSISVRAS